MAITGSKTDLTAHPLVAVVIPNRNGAQFLRHNMPSLAATDYPHWKMVLADNSSTDDSVEFIRQDFDFCQVIASHEDRGFAGNVNRLLRWSLDANAKYIAVVSNDVTVPPAWLSYAVQALEDNPNVGILGFREVANPDWLIIPRHIEVTETVYPSGCAFILRTDVIRKVGLYDETLYMYGEEQDYYPRVIRAGFTLAKTNIPLLHERHGLQNVSRKTVWLRYRNAIYCALKNFGLLAGAIVAAKIFCYAVLPDALLKRLRAGSLAHLASRATLSEGSAATVDNSVALRNGPWISRLGIFIAAITWNIFHLPSTLTRRSFTLGFTNE
ncbi:MAG: glycosyltransferase [Actinobacteria bacterium]|nr:glycosyltransferase [Actinomycetota bacterium]